MKPNLATYKSYRDRFTNIFIQIVGEQDGSDISSLISITKQWYKDI